MALFLPVALWADPLLESGDPVVGKINGQTVRLSQLEDKEINELRVKLFEGLNDRLKERALRELSQTDPAYKIKQSFDISDAKARSFYDKNQLSSRGPFESLKPQIVQYLISQEMQAELERLYAKAQAEKKVQLVLAEPQVLLVDLPIETAYLWGNEKAKVMLLEFSDYQCPFCSRVQGTMTEIRKDYGKKVLFGYRHYPLPFHEQADEAAIAAECARDQGKFEPMHQMLYQNQQALQPADLKRYAAKVGVADKGQFASCLDQEKYRNRVTHDGNQGGSVGIRGTPSFLIGRYDPDKKSVHGEVLSGALPKEQIAAVLEKYLKP